MRDVFEVPEAGPGTELVCNVGPGAEAIRLVHEPRGDMQRVCFVPTTGPGVLAVNVVEGGAPMAERRQATPAPPPDRDALTDEEQEILAQVSADWARVQGSEGDDLDALVACATSAAAGLSHSWRDLTWLEDLMMMGGNSAVMVWSSHHDAETAARLLPAFADTVVERRWLQGGPADTFEAQEAQNIMRALGESQQAARSQAGPGSTAPPTAAPPGKRRWFGRG